MHSESLFGFNVAKSINEHRYCVDKHCLSKGNSLTRACINSRLAEHMKQQNSINVNESDWDLLDNSLRSSDFYMNETLQHFAKRTKSYGLRYDIHGKLGKSFVLELLRSYRRLLGPEICPSSEKINRYERLFSNICEICERSSSGGIFRLYDLLEGEKVVRSEIFNVKQLLSLLFAFGHFESETLNGFPKSIGEFVSKYQFFIEFSEKALRTNPQPLNFQANYLISTIPFVTKLWNYYAQISSQIFSVNENAIHDPQILALYEQKIDKPKLLSRDQQLLHLRAAFSGAIQQNSYPSFSQTLQSPISFKSNFEATYHPFKHEDSSKRFFNRMTGSLFTLSDRDLFTYVREAVSDYLIMIKDIINTSDIVKIQPDQFTPGIICKFQKKQMFNQKERNYQVIIRSYHSGVSYLLTCY